MDVKMSFHDTTSSLLIQETLILLESKQIKQNGTINICCLSFHDRFLYWIYTRVKLKIHSFSACHLIHCHTLAPHLYNEFCVVMSVTISGKKRCSVRLYIQLFVGGFMFYLRYLYLFVHSGVQHILCCVFVLFVFVLSILCCQFLWIVHLLLTLLFSLTFVYEISKVRKLKRVIFFNLYFKWDTIKFRLRRIIICLICQEVINTLPVISWIT
jgi:hypothetical protein